jgi:4'-phosphopantetheinyl transferase
MQISDGPPSDEVNVGNPALTSRWIQLPCSSVDWQLGPTDVHVWAASLEMAPKVLSSFERILCSSEMARARRFHVDQHRNRFIGGRGFVRMILSHYLRTEPGKLEFAYNPHGKPSLSGAFAESRLNFNLAHSENLALLAVTRADAVGIDVERIKPLTDTDGLVAQFFSARESAAFHNLPPEQKSVAFFNLWTRKEAWLKATGEGIGHLLNVVEVSFLPGEPARFLSLPGGPKTTASWSWILHSLSPQAGFVGALTIPAQEAFLYYYRWDEETSG